MKRISIVLVSAVMMVLALSSLSFADRGIKIQENRIALVIGNGKYKSAPLKNPINDATDMADVLKKLGFSVTLKTNANQRTMERAIRDFGKKLRSGGVGLFYYAGHGLQVYGSNYLIPVGAEIESEGDAKYEAVDAGLVLAKMEDAGNDLNIIILDACRDNPFARSFRSGSKGLAKMDAPTGSILAYSTAPGSVAADGTGRNGIYTKYLLRNIVTPNLKIEDVLKNVRIGVVQETDMKQTPWESSSLMGNFYFNPTKGMVSDDQPVVEIRPQEDRPKDKLAIIAAKAKERKKEQIRKYRNFSEDINQYKEIKKSSLDNETKLIAWNALQEKYPDLSSGVQAGDVMGIVKKAIAKEKDNSLYDMVVSQEEHEAWYQIKKNKNLQKIQYYLDEYPDGFYAQEVSKIYEELRAIGKEVERDGRFIKYSTGVVKDIQTGLMWASKDNGENINWKDAKWYCENYRGGGYTDWRLPTIDEFTGLYDRSKSYQATPNRDYVVHLTKLIQLTTNYPWASETRGSNAAHFHFGNGARYWNNQSNSLKVRALPVRSGN